MQAPASVAAHAIIVFCGQDVRQVNFDCFASTGAAA
jgi:hypothetical protein